MKSGSALRASIHQFADCNLPYSRVLQPICLFRPVLTFILWTPSSACSRTPPEQLADAQQDSWAPLTSSAARRIRREDTCCHAAGTSEDARGPRWCNDECSATWALPADGMTGAQAQHCRRCSCQTERFVALHFVQGILGPKFYWRWFVVSRGQVPALGAAPSRLLALNCHGP